MQTPKSKDSFLEGRKTRSPAATEQSAGRKTDRDRDDDRDEPAGRRRETDRRREDDRAQRDDRRRQSERMRDGDLAEQDETVGRRRPSERKRDDDRSQGDDAVVRRRETDRRREDDDVAQRDEAGSRRRETERKREDRKTVYSKNEKQDEAVSRPRQSERNRLNSPDFRSDSGESNETVAEEDGVLAVLHEVAEAADLDEYGGRRDAVEAYAHAAYAHADISLLKNDYRELLQHEEDLLDIPLEDGRNGRDGRRELSADHQFAAEYMETTYAKSQEVNDRRMRKLWVRPEDPASTKNLYSCFSYPHVLSASSVLDSDEALEERLKVFDTKLFKSTEKTTQMGRWQANGERWHAVGEGAHYQEYIRQYQETQDAQEMSDKERWWSVDRWKWVNAPPDCHGSPMSSQICNNEMCRICSRKTGFRLPREDKTLDTSYSWLHQPHTLGDRSQRRPSTADERDARRPSTARASIVAGVRPPPGVRPPSPPPSTWHLWAQRNTREPPHAKAARRKAWGLHEHNERDHPPSLKKAQEAVELSYQIINQTMKDQHKAEVHARLEEQRKLMGDDGKGGAPVLDDDRKSLQGRQPKQNTGAKTKHAATR